jgi:hypothetical protein
MKIKLIFIILLLSSGFALSQTGGLKNNGVKIVISENTKLDVNGDKNAAYVNNENGTIELNGVFAIEGDWTNNSSEENIFTVYGPNAEVIFDGNEEQTIGDSTSTKWQNLTIKGEFKLSQELEILKELNMDNGIITLGENNLVIKKDAEIIPSADFSKTNMIVTNGSGKVIRYINEDGEYFFPLGDLKNGANYSPVQINTSGSSYSNAYITTKVINEKHPEIEVDEDYLKRYWSVEQNGISNFSGIVYLDYNYEDIIGDQTYFHGLFWNGEEWIQLEDVFNNQIFGVIDQSGDITAKGKKDPTDIDDKSEEEIEIYVSDDHLIIKNVDAFSDARISVYNVLGQRLLTRQFSQKMQNRININSIDDNVCIVNIRGKDINFSRKVYIP